MPKIDTVIVGTKFRGTNAINCMYEMRADAVVRLVREPSNPHDGCAVACYFGGTHIGYVPRQTNPEIAAAMDRGCAPIATVTEAGDGTIISIRREPKIRVEWEEPS